MGVTVTVPKFLYVGSSSISQYSSESVADMMKDPRGLLCMWDPPKPRAKYIMGLDPTEGRTGWTRGTRIAGDHKIDNAVIEVYQVDAHKEPIYKEVPNPNGRGYIRQLDIDPMTKQQRYKYIDVQVAEFSAPCDAVEIARVANVIGRIYAGDEEDQCELIYEAWPGPGLLTTQELLRLGYGNLWMWEYIDSTVEQSDRPGWRSTPRTQKILWDRSRRHLLNKQATIRSKWCVAEYANAEIDINKMRAKACFIPGTPVLTGYGSWKPIDTFSRGDLVVNRNGERGVVADCIESKFTGDLVEIKSKGCIEPNLCTPQHYIWTKPNLECDPEWKPAGNLVNGDKVWLPKRLDLSFTTFTIDQLWVMGFWLAEGSYLKFKGSRCGIQFDNSDVAMLKRAFDILSDWFPINECPERGDGYIYRRSTRGSIQTRKAPRKLGYKTNSYLSFGSYQAAQLFFTHLGEYSDQKILSEELMNSKGIIPLIAGYFDGDGTQRHNQQWDSSLYTNSYHLANQFRRILLDHDVWHSLHKVKRRKPTSKDQYVLNIKANESWVLALYSERMIEVDWISRCSRVHKTSEGYWVPVSIGRVPYSGSVYDLSVEGEHSYLAREFCVHNSYGYHDDRMQASNMCFWAGHRWCYDPERTEEKVSETLINDYQRMAPTLDDYESFEDWKSAATADWE
jgi:hypothetical protein